MTTHPLYEHGRTSALPGGDRPGRPDYDLVAHLRAVRTAGDEAMTAVEEYDPDFSLKLSNCRSLEAAEALLAEWLDRREAALRHTQAELHRVWVEAQAHPEQRP